MIIKTKLSQQDFIRVNFVLLYSRILIKAMTVFGILMLIAAIFTAIVDPARLTAYVVIAPFFIGGVYPLLTYFTAKRNYASSQRISETIEYDFQKDNLYIKGESFTSTLSWNKIYKVSKMKNWLLIWQNKQIANVIHRRDIWEGDITKLKDILNELHVKNNL